MNIKQELKKLTKRKIKKSKPKSSKAKKRQSVKQKRGFKKKYSDYLKSKDWADIRIDLFNVRGGKCERCGSTVKLEVHHLHYRNVFKEEPSDLIILCRICHQLEHDKCTLVM